MDMINKQISEVFDFFKFSKSETLIKSMSLYIKLLFSWHKTHNIIGTNDPSYFIKRDVFDSIAMCKHLPNGKLLDVGTGGGIPGLIIAMIRKNSNIILLDKKEKPIRFLEQVKSKLDITNINIIHQSFEKFRDADDIAGIVLKNFSNKQLSKMSYHDKVFTITEVARKNYGTNLPIYFLTGSNALSLNKQFTKNKFTLSKIDTPFFENKRFLLETRT
tara:strand:- start:53 stop:703 length:651 start_codon:yes stop_codon:yes gene_type:complete